MDDERAVACLSALGQETRLRIMRSLTEAGDDGIASGQLALHMEASTSAMSAHLRILAAAGLIGSRRIGKSIVYFLMPDAIEDLADVLEGLRHAAADARGG